MPDVVTNLLALSGDATSPAELLKLALDVVVDATKAEAAAVARATPPTWAIVAARNVVAATVPTDLAAESLERETVVRADRWLAAPLTSSHRSGGDTELSHVLLLRGNCSDGVFADIARSVAEALAIVTRTTSLRRRANRLEAMLAITRKWQQTNDMETLLSEMAEAAIKMFDADRASIFLWDKPNKTIVGRPALGVKGGELRLADTAGIVGQVIQTGETRRVTDSDANAGIERAVDKQTGYKTKSLLCVPLVSASGSRLGAFEVLNKKSGAFTAEDEPGLIELASYAAVALESTQQFEELLTRHQRLVELAAQDTSLVGDSPAIQALRSTVSRLGNTDLAILILGENGTGKEVVAQSIHYGSRRRTEPFIAVNCAALTETLLESELFGHEKGAFTDAHESRAGKFELASGGTLFLDEIGDMSLAGQAKLLRVLEEKDDRSRRRQPLDSHRRPRAGRHESEPGRNGAGKAVSPGPLLPPERRDARSAAAARARRRHPAAGRAFLAALLRQMGRANAEVDRRRSQAADQPSVAGQRPRAAEPDGAAGVPVARRPDRGRRIGVHSVAGRPHAVARRDRPELEHGDPPIPDRITSGKRSSGPAAT